MIGGVKLVDVIKAVEACGDEATNENINKHIIDKRENSLSPYWSPYKSELIFKNVIFQKIQEHCDDYKKCKVKKNHDIRFERIEGVTKSDIRFRLAPKTDS